MKRSLLDFVAVAAFGAFGTTASTVLAHHGSSPGGGSHYGGQQVTHLNNFGSNQFNSVRQATFNGPNLNNLHPIKITPTLPVGPLGPGKFPIGPIKPTGNGGVVGPIGPIGPIKPPGCNPTGNCNPGCKPWWPPIILGCVPCGGYYGGCYYPPVYTQTVVVPASTSLVVTEAPLTTVATVEKLPQVPVGSTLTLSAKDLGVKGQTLLMIDKLVLSVQIDEWTNDHATVTLPMLNVTGPTKAEIVLVKADGYAVSNVKVELVPAPVKPTSEAVASVVR